MGFLDKFKKKNQEVASDMPTQSKGMVFSADEEDFIDKNDNTVKIRGNNIFVPSGKFQVAKEVLEDTTPLETSRIFNIRLQKNIPEQEKVHRFAKIYAANLPIFYKATNIMAGLTVILVIIFWVHEVMKDNAHVYISSPTGYVKEMQTYEVLQHAIGVAQQLNAQLIEKPVEKQVINDVPIKLFAPTDYFDNPTKSQEKPAGVALDQSAQSQKDQQ